MKYLFDMGEVWHVYADMGNQWIYYRMEQVGEETLDKEGNKLPGPLGRLELFDQLEKQCRIYKEQTERCETECRELEEKFKKLQMQMQQEKQAIEEEKKKEVANMRQQFEASYAELQKLAEDMQEEGRKWRQRYLDLAYQQSPKGK